MNRDSPDKSPVTDDKTTLEIWVRRATLFGLAVLTVYLVMLAGGKLMWAIAPEPVPEPEHVQELTATWGSFDEVCLYRYYKRADYPDRPVKPGHEIEYGGENWSCIACDDIIGTNFGDCWEAVFRRT